eukprot:gene16361-biopygen2466
MAPLGHSAQPAQASVAHESDPGYTSLCTAVGADAGAQTFMRVGRGTNGRSAKRGTAGPRLRCTSCFPSEAKRQPPASPNPRQIPAESPPNPRQWFSGPCQC